MTKIIGLANSCKDCPERHYYSGGTYECLKVKGSTLNVDSSIPSWCPLADYPPLVGAESAAQICDSVAEQSRNSLFRSGAKICAGQIRAFDAEEHQVLIGYDKSGDAVFGTDPEACLAAPVADSAMAKDAQRYRWLRNPDPAIHRELDVCDDFMVVQEGRHLDEAIDAAIAASEPKKTGD